MEKNVTTKVDRTITVTFDEDALHTMLRKECGAPVNAVVNVDSWGEATVTWTVTEYDNGASA